MIKLNDNAKWGRNPAERKQLVTELYTKYGIIVSRKQVMDFIESTGRTIKHVAWLVNRTSYRCGRGEYTLKSLIIENPITVTVESVEASAAL